MEIGRSKEQGSVALGVGNALTLFMRFDGKGNCSSHA